MPSSSIGRNAISARAMAASEPSNPARGTSRRTRLPIGAQITLNTPTSTSTVRPTCQANIIARSWSSFSSVRAICSAGSSTSSATPNVLGVSRPSGIAVTSLRPVRRARRKAIQL